MNTQLQQRLAELRSRTMLAGLGSAIVWGLLCACVVLLAAMWLDLVIELSPAIRMASGAAAVVGASILLARLLRMSMRIANPAAIAGRLDSAASARGEIVSGIDLALHPADGSAALTVGLSAIAVNRAAQMVAGIPTSAVISLRQLKKPAVILFAIALLSVFAAVIAPRMAATQWLRFVDPYGDHPPYSSLVFNIDPGNIRVVYGSAVDVNVKLDGGTADRVDLVLVGRDGQGESVPMFPEPGSAWRASVANVTEPCEYFIKAGRARSVKYQIGVITVPRIETVAFHVTWPAYTNRPPYDGPLPQGGLVGLPGTSVRVRAKSNRSLSGGTMFFSQVALPTTVPTTQPATIAMLSAPGSSNEVEGTFEIRTPGKLTVGVTDTEQQASTDSFTASVGVLKDERPFVRLTEPKPNSFATPDVTIQVIASAEDDFGVSTLSHYRGLNDTRPRPMEIAVPAKHPTQVQGAISLPLSEYGLRPGMW